MTRRPFTTVATTSAGMALGLALGLAITTPAHIPQCHEDQVILHTGTCANLDDPRLDYVGDIGWTLGDTP